MSQPPFEHDDTQPGAWGAPPPGSAPPPPYPSHQGSEQSGSEQYGGESHGSEPYGGQQYGAPPPYGAQQPYGAQPAYGQPAYGQPPYGVQQPYGAQPGEAWPGQPYGQPGYGGYYGEPPRRGNGMAIAGFVLAFFFWPLGLVFSIIGLRRSTEPGRGLRGLAIAGIVISAVAAVITVLGIIGALGDTTTSGSSFDTTDGTTNAAPSSSSSSPAPAAGSETVADACHVIVPAVTGIQSDIQSATSVSDMLDKVNQLADTVEQQGAATGDAAFQQDTADLADQYRALLHAAQTGGTPDYSSLAKAGEQVGFDCGRVGVTD